MGWLNEFKEERRQSKARKRATQASTFDLISWVDVALTDISRKVRSGTGEDLSLARQSSETLWSILEELEARTAPRK